MWNASGSTIFARNRLFLPNFSAQFRRKTHLNNHNWFLQRSNVQISELQQYRLKARTLKTQCKVLLESECVKKKTVAVRDFWRSNQIFLPRFYQLTMNIAFFVGSSAGGE